MAKRKYTRRYQKQEDEPMAQDDVEQKVDDLVMENLQPHRALELERRSVFSDESVTPVQPPIEEGSTE